MKIQKFLIWIQDKLLNYPDISISTVKMIVDSFHKCLSEKEVERNNLLLQVISEITLKQITIDTIVQNSKIESFENELNILKELGKNE